MNLNKDVYSIYIKAKADGQGYMKRMKEMWDIMHPDLNITAKICEKELSE